MDESYHPVSSIEELKAMQYNKNYRLDCDIDFQGEEWLPVRVNNFDGGGHVIKNFSVFELPEFSHITNDNIGIGFFAKSNIVENVVFEEITINVSRTDSEDHTTFCGIVSGEGKEFKNVKVNNCSAKFLISNKESFIYIGGMSGATAVAENCILENVTVDAYSLSSFTYAGGVTGSLGFGLGFGDAPDLKSCKVINLTLTCNAANAMGGLVGYMMETNSVIYSLKDSYIKDSKIEITSPKVIPSRAGGIIGYCADFNTEITNCASIGNEIYIFGAFGKYCSYEIGGIAGMSCGKISECLSQGNILTGKGDSNSEKVIARVGGICGYSEGTVSGCVAQLNAVSGTQLSGTNVSACGLVAQSKSSIVNCAVFANTIKGINRDIFTEKNDRIFNCFISDNEQSFPNVNKIEIMDDWNNAIDILTLNSDLWTIDENGILNLIIVG